MKTIIHHFILLTSIVALVSSCGSSSDSTTEAFVDPSTYPELSPIPEKGKFFGAYTIDDPKTGAEATAVIKNGKRILKANSLPNHVTGDFPNEGNPNTYKSRDVNYEVTMTPKYVGTPQRIKESGFGVNGIKFDPGTGERVNCASGEVYVVEGKQDLISVGLDLNNAHVQPTGDYHYHGAPSELIKLLDQGGDLVHIGFAHDGFPVYYSKSGTFKPSFQLKKALRSSGTDCDYRGKAWEDLAGTSPDGSFESDWEFKDGLGDLDACNGLELNGHYIYLITTEYPFINRCLMGEYERPTGFLKGLLGGLFGNPPPGDPPPAM